MLCKEEIMKNGITRPPSKFEFPFKLHKLLDEVAHGQLDHIVRWHESGRAFRIFERNSFEKKIMPFFFCQTKYKSFTRQLNIYGFKRVQGPQSEFHQYYFHPHFVKGQPDLCFLMNRVKIVGKNKTRPTMNNLDLLSTPFTVATPEEHTRVQQESSNNCGVKHVLNIKNTTFNPSRPLQGKSLGLTKNDMVFSSDCDIFDALYEGVFGEKYTSSGYNDDSTTDTVRSCSSAGGSFPLSRQRKGVPPLVQKYVQVDDDDDIFEPTPL